MKKDTIIARFITITVVTLWRFRDRNTKNFLILEAKQSRQVSVEHIDVSLQNSVNDGPVGFGGTHRPVGEHGAKATRLGGLEFGSLVHDELLGPAGWDAKLLGGICVWGSDGGKGSEAGRVKRPSNVAGKSRSRSDSATAASFSPSYPSGHRGLGLRRLVTAFRPLPLVAGKRAPPPSASLLNQKR